MITVVETSPEHIRALGHNLRERDMAMAKKVGIPAHRALWRVYKKSVMCRTIFVNNEIAAIWGVAGSFLGSVGKPWMVASPLVEDYPTKLMFRYRSELRSMLRFFPILEDWVSKDDEKTMKLLKIIGFTFDDSHNNPLFIKATLER